MPYIKIELEIPQDDMSVKFNEIVKKFYIYGTVFRKIDNNRIVFIRKLDDVNDITATIQCDGVNCDIMLMLYTPQVDTYKQIIEKYIGILRALINDIIDIILGQQNTSSGSWLQTTV